MTRRLLISVHDVAPSFERKIDRLLELIAGSVDGRAVTMLVVPHHWNSKALRPGTPFATRLRSWAEQGAEIFLHGWTHRDDSQHRGVTAFKARYMTAGEGEFLGLSREEALDRMTRGKGLLEEIVGMPVEGFVAPAWLYSPGARQALGEAGFRLAEDHTHVWSPADGDRKLAGDPVITWASRSASRRISSLAAAAFLRRVLRTRPVARVGVHPGDTSSPALLASIETTLRLLNHTHAVRRYADLLTDGGNG
ncbi:DUF2334 domain-containing protein [Sphingomonas koreensis]